MHRARIAGGDDFAELVADELSTDPGETDGAWSPVRVTVISVRMTEAPTQTPPAAPAAPEPIMQFFAYGHLPPDMQAISRMFASVAESVVSTLPRNAERSVALRKLLEAKDAAVRASIAK